MSVRAAVFALALVLAFLAQSDADAHCFVGARFLPSTLNVDDPCVADELSLPTVSALKTGNEPPARELDISAEFSKHITETFGVSVSPNWTRLSQPGMPSPSGFQNLETSLKWQFLTDGAHERVMSATVVVDRGGTGASGVGAESFSTIIPTLYVGQGFGQLPESINWAKPFAVTGQIGYTVPSGITDLPSKWCFARKHDFHNSSPATLIYYDELIVSALINNNNQESSPHWNLEWPCWHLISPAVVHPFSDERGEPRVASTEKIKVEGAV